MRILNTLETYAMLAVICLTSPFGLRDHALIRFLLLTGLRVGEVVGLNIRDVWVNGRPSPWLELPAEICKGHRARQIPLSPAAQRAVTDLVAFLQMRGFSVAPDSPLLTDRRHNRLPVREIQRMVQHYRQLAGLGKKPTPHTFRHTFCSRAIGAGANPRTVQLLAGHRRLETTEVYLHCSPEQMAQAVAGVTA